MGEISSLKEKGHQILIVDFGVYQPEFLTTINNLDIKFIVTRGEEWKVNELYYLLNSQEQADFYNWKIIVPFGVKEELKEIRRETKKKVSSFFFYKDPFLWTKELKNEIEKILEI